MAAKGFRYSGRFWTAVLQVLAAGFLLAGNFAAELNAGPNRAGSRPMLIQPLDLQKELNQPGLRILDTRSQADYSQSHIPGAVWVDVKHWTRLGSKEGGLHDAGVWAKEVGHLGIVQDSSVVVYGSALPDTARIWWMLKYFGMPNVTILDGGWQRWTSEKLPTDFTSPRVKQVEFAPNFQADRLEEMDSLKKSLRSADVALLDTRSEAEFTGKDVRGKRGGHIPGAKLLEWKEVLAKDGRFKSPEQLQELFRRHGIQPQQTAITC